MRSPFKYRDDLFLNIPTTYLNNKKQLDDFIIQKSLMRVRASFYRKEIYNLWR